ncbi:MAG: hypothetical protein KVP17_003259 [Porospora cf. gigantea B]|uniref:uncharacterized protein n=1 Tax=Porospora cf. gigantea B TaxID=2853592 RepID=UPI0035719B46|nr:MAG: hypothetical protein KVP17_003259 [Porospora cf. gigantea B]
MYRPLALGFESLLFALEQYLNLRQKRTYERTLTSGSAKDKEGCEYALDKMVFRMTKAAVMLAIEFYFWLYLYPTMWSLASQSSWATTEYSQTLVFFALKTPFDLLETLTFDFYYDFVLEEKHGFNKKTLSLFFCDTIKSFCLQVVIGAPLTWVIIKLIRWGGPAFYIYVWIFSVVFILCMMLLYPTVIAPLFNKYEPLQDTELKRKIEGMAAEFDFPLTRLYQVDSSIRSSHSNAYFYGFWKAKRIVIYDTLLDLPHEQIVAVLAHEIGHWRHWHTFIQVNFVFVNLFATFFLYGLVRDNQAMFHSFGYYDDTFPVVIGFVLFSALYSPMNTLLNQSITMLTRRFEFEADAFAVRTGHGEQLVKALEALEKQNKSPRVFDKWYAWWNYDHPPTVERTEAIAKLSKKQE